MDHFLEEIVTLAGPETHTVMVSDHGFMATTQIFYLNAWLEQNGYLKWTDGAEPEQPGKLGLESMARRFYEVDWDKTTAYSPTPSGNGIYLSLDGSDAAPEAYVSTRQQLTDDLQRFIDPATGKPVVTRIRTREEAFAGQHMTLAPDLTLDLRDGGFVSILPSNSVLMPRAEPTGTHHQDGIFIAGGPGICQGATLPTLSIIDVAPTLLYTLGLPVPEDLEGRVPTEVFDPERLQANPVRREGLTKPPETLTERTADPPDEAGEAELLHRLRALGYVE